MSRSREIYCITAVGGAVNVLLVIVKYLFGILGHSSALVADATHSLSDLLSDIVVLLFVHLSRRPRDADHDYGHGKYETLATSFVGLLLLAAGVMIAYTGAAKTILFVRGEHLASPSIAVLVVALVSVLLKEATYRVTLAVGTRVQSPVVIANAWHHRSDALSSLGTLLGIGGAIFLGSSWVVLDPLAAVVVGVIILRTAWQLLRQASDELLEKSLSEDIKREITIIACQENGITEVHNLRTRRIGSGIAIEMHVRLPGEMTLYVAHAHATAIERALKDHFGSNTHVVIHVEPEKHHGRYLPPRG